MQSLRASSLEIIFYSKLNSASLSSPLTGHSSVSQATPNGSKFSIKSQNFDIFVKKISHVNSPTHTLHPRIPCPILEIFSKQIYPVPLVIFHGMVISVKPHFPNSRKMAENYQTDDNSPYLVQWPPAGPYTSSITLQVAIPILKRKQPS